MQTPCPQAEGLGKEICIENARQGSDSWESMVTKARGGESSNKAYEGLLIWPNPRKPASLEQCESLTEDR